MRSSGFICRQSRPDSHADRFRQRNVHVGKHLSKTVDGATATKRSSFTEPSAGPTAGTGHTLDEIYNLIRSFVPKTGQTTSVATGDEVLIR
jgi:hypothetical protein